MEFLASHDPLTGIKNRRSLEDKMATELSRFKRYDTPFSVVFIDVNKFKPINDTYGHDCGDRVLQYIAFELSSLIRASDEVYRFAGDEFVITLANQTHEEAIGVANRLTEHFTERTFKYANHELQPRISCGTAECMQGDHMDELLKRADHALYAVKKQLAAHT
ncbi:GGDEF domain-containing protein [Saccharobesus litoralis]|uniref:GGDEF domain-containing protein n=1 Tax=Saccharobesus litoralis TaxID=2172099 RepID=UPI0038B4EC84